MYEEYKAEVQEVTLKYVERYIQEIQHDVEFEKMFVINEYEGEGISNTQVTFSVADENFICPIDAVEIYSDFMGDTQLDAHLDEAYNEEYAIGFEMLMYNSFGFDWAIQAEFDGENISYKIHTLESKNLDL